MYVKIGYIILGIFFMAVLNAGELRASGAATGEDKRFEKKIYFGHQSVGADILNGVAELAGKGNQVGFEVLSLEEVNEISAPAVYHSRIGQNTKPLTKIKDFARVLRSGVGKEVDMAFFKFCYVDFSKQSDVERVFNKYKEMVDGLQNDFPLLRICHITVPLTSKQKGIKAWIKKLLGRPVRGYAGNMARNRFNELLRQEYECIFDLAKAESTYPDGHRSYFKKNGKNWFTLVSKYTNDGGHLNNLGRKVAAKSFIDFVHNSLKP